jgi:GAF domain-containing protein/HAMP domain-containing protein
LLQDEIGYTPYQLAALDDVEVYPGLKGDLVVGAGTPTEITDEWFAIVEQPVIEPLRSAAVQIIILTIAFTLSSVVVASIIRFSRQQIEQPLRQLRQSAEVVSGGNLRYRAELAVDNEFGELAAAFNTMASDLEGLVLNLEDRVAERTDDLRMTAELGRLVTVQRDLDLLLPYAVDIIQRRTGFYHVQIFLIDEQGEYAHLRASTGDVGRRLIEAKHQLAVGSRSVIGQVTQTGQPVIALDTADAAVVHRPNPLLPNTRSEMALPLRGARGVIGAIDVQSLEPVAFTEGDIETFQVLADQLANAIESARRIRALEQRAREAESLNRVLVGQAYSELARQRRASTVGYTRTGGELAEDREWTPALSRVVLGGETVVEQTATGRHLALPIISRGTTVGAFEFEFDEDEWHEDAVELAQVLVDRVTVSLETARLFEESQRLVAREQTVNRFTTQLQGQNEVEELLSIAAQEIRSALNARRAAIRIGGRQET